MPNHHPPWGPSAGGSSVSRIFPAMLVLAVLAALPARADLATSAYRNLGIPVGNVLSGTTLTAKVVPGAAKQVISVVTYFTRTRKDLAHAVNVRLQVFRQRDGDLIPLYGRDLGEENDGYVARGELELVDLDRDGVNEIIVSFDDIRDPLIDRRVAEVIVHGDDGFRTAWRGDVRYDATRAARRVPADHRDRFVREVDIPNTLRTRGVTLFIKKTVLAVAGERLPRPKVVQETFPLRRRPPQ